MTLFLVLNLIINGLPSKLNAYPVIVLIMYKVLNLIINGLPSKLKERDDEVTIRVDSFKPYYKWITF